MPAQHGSMLTVYFGMAILFAILACMPWKQVEAVRPERRALLLARLYVGCQAIWFLVFYLTINNSGTRIYATFSDVLIFFSYTITIFTFAALSHKRPSRISWAAIILALAIAIILPVLTPNYVHKLHWGNLGAIILLAENVRVIRTYARTHNNVAARTLWYMAFFFVGLLCLRSLLLFYDPSLAIWNESYISFMLPLMALTVTILVLASLALSAQNQLLHMALRDKLTGLRNRHALMEDYRAFAGRADRHGTGFALLVCDLDHFKAVNDQYGHDRGDLVLKRVATTMQTMLRDNDIAARIGGEEFILLISETGQQGLDIISARLLEMIRDLDFTEIAPGFQQTTSIGAVLVKDGATSFDDAFRLADQRLYQAKQNGRNKAITIDGHIS